MILRVDIWPAASKDADLAADWFDRQRPGLGRDFLVEVDRTVTRVAEYPESSNGSTRRCVAPFSAASITPLFTASKRMSYRLSASLTAAGGPPSFSAASSPQRLNENAGP
jgi:hypothetical protein